MHFHNSIFIFRNSVHGVHVTTYIIPYDIYLVQIHFTIVTSDKKIPTFFTYPYIEEEIRNILFLELT